MGTPGAADAMDRPWTSGFFKVPVAGPVRVGRLNLEGDGQAGLVNHGGVDKAVLAYAAGHYPAWRDDLGIDLPPGAFGENLTVDGVDERDVCVGDVWRVGDVVMEVSQPRQPCWKLARRWRLKELPARVVETGRSGWYLRVRAEGTVEAGRPVVLEARPHPRWTIRAVQRAFYEGADDWDANLALARVEELAEAWRGTFRRRARGAS